MAGFYRTAGFYLVQPVAAGKSARVFTAGPWLSISSLRIKQQIRIK
jgi:hypothetical protein